MCIANISCMWEGYSPHTFVLLHQLVDKRPLLGLFWFNTSIKFTILFHSFPLVFLGKRGSFPLCPSLVSGNCLCPNNVFCNVYLYPFWVSSKICSNFDHLPLSWSWMDRISSINSCFWLKRFILEVDPSSELYAFCQPCLGFLQQILCSDSVSSLCFRSGKAAGSQFVFHNACS